MRSIIAALAACALLAGGLAGCANPTPAQQALETAVETVVVQAATDPNCLAAINSAITKTPSGSVGTACEEDAAGNVLKAGVSVLPSVVPAATPAASIPAPAAALATPAPAAATTNN